MPPRANLVILFDPSENPELPKSQKVHVAAGLDLKVKMTATIYFVVPVLGNTRKKILIIPAEERFSDTGTVSPVVKMLIISK